MIFKENYIKNKFYKPLLLLLESQNISIFYIIFYYTLKTTIYQETMKFKMHK